MHTAAISPSVDAVCISGHFQSRQQIWQEPIHRNVQGLLTKFGDAELVAMIAPDPPLSTRYPARKLISVATVVHQAN